MHTITEVSALPDYRLALTFDDGVKGEVDLSGLVGQGVFSLWQQAGMFEQVRIGSSGELAWGDQIDLCPDSLYLKVTGMSVEELFPALRHETTHA